jgi:predicted molibdopterin-dependent oxidoreductase YjgC
MENLEFVLYQDIFMNETGEYADVILPAVSFAEKDGTFTNSDRRVQLIHPAIQPPGEARPDWEIIQDLARRVQKVLGVTSSVGFNFNHPAEVWQEMADLTPPFQGITHERIEKEDGVHWPCPSERHPGTPYLFSESFPRGKGKLTPISYRPSAELPDKEYPLILSTGRVLYHWHGGTLTRRSKLDDIYPEALVEIHPADGEELGISSGDWVSIRSRRGEIKARSLITERSPVGTVFIPFHFVEAAANILTIDARDPQAKIPDYKVCAVYVEKVPA